MQTAEKAGSSLPTVFRFGASKNLAATIIDGAPWFIAKDVCDILQLRNVTKTLNALDADEKLTLQIVRSGQRRTVNCVNESGLYNIIFRSNKPEAKAFRKWVTAEVLPQLRASGSYALPTTANANIVAALQAKKHTNSNELRRLRRRKYAILENQKELQRLIDKVGSGYLLSI